LAKGEEGDFPKGEGRKRREPPASNDEAGSAEEGVCLGLPEALARIAAGEQEVLRLQSELRLSAAALVSSQEMERKRMASELHDSIGQELNAISFAIRLSIDQLRKGALTELTGTLESLSGQARGAIEEVRRIALNLRPAMLDDLGVIGTLSWFFRQVRALHPRLDLHVEIDAEERNVPDALRTPIYRVVQEAISNVVKHSSATVIKVSLVASAKKVELSVKDNGSGFTVPPDFSLLGKAHASCGLAGMRNRVEFSGGKFTMTSKLGKGTSIKAVWPLRPHTEEGS
jgi:signal transduction histidine kinase